MIMKLFICILLFLPTLLFAQDEAINQTDESGKKQGYWVFLGKDVPDLGLSAEAKAEEGMYRDNKKIGSWKRYNEDGLPICIVLYGSTVEDLGLRVGLFAYQYYANKQLKLKPEPSLCQAKANVTSYDEKGLIIEYHSYDSLCNDYLTINLSDTVSVQRLEYFEKPPFFSQKVEFGVIKSLTNSLTDLTGYYFLDFNHKIFQFGEFVNGVLINGSECVLEEDMSLVSIREFKNGKYSCSYLP